MDDAGRRTWKRFGRRQREQKVHAYLPYLVCMLQYQWHVSEIGARAAEPLMECEQRAGHYLTIRSFPSVAPKRYHRSLSGRDMSMDMEVDSSEGESARIALHPVGLCEILEEILEEILHPRQRPKLLFPAFFLLLSPYFSANYRPHVGSIYSNNVWWFSLAS